jgi:hypothetical protein
VAPTVFKENGFRFFLFSRAETRPHIHITHSDGEAKFWISPEVDLAMSSGLSSQQIRVVEKMVQQHLEEILYAWNKHFPN